MFVNTGAREGAAGDGGWRVGIPNFSRGGGIRLECRDVKRAFDTTFEHVLES